MNKTKIEWADFSWNPIKGICPERCWYCYARSIYERFKLDPEPWLDVVELDMALHTKRTSKRVFVCSTFELFNPIADTILDEVRGWSWRDYIFDVIRRRPDMTFIILTKRPERIDRPMPPNVWLGVSVTVAKDSRRILDLYKIAAEVRFASFEPLLEDPGDFDPRLLNWAIIGRLTGHGSQRDPRAWMLESMVQKLKKTGMPIFLKNNLGGIWPGPLIQEFPK